MGKNKSTTPINNIILSTTNQTGEAVERSHETLHALTSIFSKSGTQIDYFDETHLSVSLSDAKGDNISSIINTYHTKDQQIAHDLQKIDDMIKSISMIQGIQKIPLGIQKNLGIELDTNRNGYLLDYTEETIIPYIYLSIKDRKKHRGIGTKLMKRIVEDADKKLYNRGGIKTIMSNRSHGEGTKFDHNTNLDCLNNALYNGERDIDALIQTTPAGKIITRLGWHPIKVLIKIDHTKCDHMIIRYARDDENKVT